MAHVISSWRSLGTPNNHQTDCLCRELAFSCLQRCTLLIKWGMFVYFISSAKCWCSVSILKVDVASIMFAERCCYFFVIIGMVLCLQSSGLKCSVGLIVFSTCLFICSRCFFTSLIVPINQLSSYIFLPGRILWMCCVGKPFDHVVLSRCLPGGTQVFFVDRSGVVNSVQLLF